MELGSERTTACWIPTLQTRSFALPLTVLGEADPSRRWHLEVTIINEDEVLETCRIRIIELSEGR